MRKLTLLVALAAAATVGCEKTGEGEYEVERPVVGTETDTVETPSVDVGMDRDTVKVPDVDVNTEEKEIKTPDVDVQTPSERENR